MSVPTSASAAASVTDVRFTPSVAAERRGTGRRAVAPELDLLCLRLGRLEPGLALLPEAVALAIKRDRVVERRFAAFELAHYLLEPLQGRLERESLDVLWFVPHRSSIDPARAGGQDDLIHWSPRACEK